MNDEEVLGTVKHSRFYKIIITQAICTAIILLSVLTVKYFFKDCYLNLQGWYEKNICAETDVNEVLSQGGGDVSEI